MTKHWASSAVAVALFSVGMYLHLGSGSTSVVFSTLTVGLGTIEKKAVAVGKMVPAHSVSIKSQINGIAGEIYARVGEKVEQGQPLIKIMPNPTPQELTDASTTLMLAEVDLEAKKQRLTNLESLIKQEIILSNYNDYVDVSSTVKAAQAKVLQKRQMLELIHSGEAFIGDTRLTSTIYAPIKGTVLNLKIEVGEPIISTESRQVATQIMSLADMKTMIFKGSVSEHDAAQLILGMPVTLTVAPYPEVEIRGVLTKVAIQSEQLNYPTDTKTKSFDNGFEVEVGELVIPENVHLRSGFSSTAKITLKKSENVLTIPERALKFKGKTPMVLIPDQSEQGFYTRPVKLGLSDGINVEVYKGIEADEKIIDNSTMGEIHD
ncbi:efflux RND transporter periplasmic adaptor subunit [Candidatus Enterovibrio escicola]|uniref:Membrane-fusion protein n=1 Tax=Candidatus Enterovibrio escicola TaxID=1927127 RepID=A0A2A5T7L7_9GAMM|nr:efflux RND transporter periplasmic adaptor subunit [Candidatus Enterovibrio escacola]PCS24118.1 Membrane-fusion protein [Candidatus Enterovibrio escacola]